MAKIMGDWLINYKSPQTIGDLINQAPTNIKSTFQVEGLRILAVSVLFVFLVVSALVTSARPAIWGLGIFELNLTFPDMGVFQAKAYQQFFNQPLDDSFSINNFSRKPIISRCWSNLPSSMTNNYWLYQPVDQEIRLSQDNGTKQMGVAVINNACNLNSDELTQENKDNATIYQLSDSYFQIAYPGSLQNDTGGSSLRTSITGAINQQYESDKKRLWVRKNNALICSSSDSFDVDQLISVAGNFKTSPLDTTHCPQTVNYKSPVTPGKLAFTLSWNLSKDEMQKVLNAYGASSCENRWSNEYWSFLCTVPVGSEDKIIEQTKNDHNINKVSRWYGN